MSASRQQGLFLEEKINRQRERERERKGEEEYCWDYLCMVTFRQKLEKGGREGEGEGKEDPKAAKD